MADVYVVQMVLVPYYVVPPDVPHNACVEAVEAAMDQRFTPPMRRRWSRLVFSGTLTQAQLAAALNAQLSAPELVARIAADLSVPPDDIKAVIGVSNGSWTPGGGGFHESIATVQAETNVFEEWTFNVPVAGRGVEVTVRCWCRWSLETVVP